MTHRFVAAVAIAASTILIAGNATALTMDQVAAICDSHEGECSEHPLVQSYVGGALDLIAVLDEETNYLGEVYCEEPIALFDVPKIVKYMETHRVEYADRNAMLLVIRFLEENGGC